MPSNTPSPYSSPWSQTEITAWAGSTIVPSRQIFRARISSRAVVMWLLLAVGRAPSAGTADGERCTTARDGVRAESCP